MKNLMNKFIDTQFTRLETILLDQLNTNELPDSLESKKIYIVGSGSSLNAAKATSKYFPMRVTVETPEVFLKEFNNIAVGNYENSILIAISQTASSIATMTTLKKMKDIGAYTVLITANEDFENSSIADTTLDLMASEETIGPKSLGYTATVVRLIQLAEMMHQKMDKNYSRTLQEQLFDGIEKLPKVKDIATKWIQDNGVWSELGFYTIAASEDFVNLTRECCLKLLEVVRKPAMNYEIGEFTHGPHRLFSSMCGNIFVVNADDCEFADKIAKFGQSENSKTLIIEFDGDETSLNSDSILLPNVGAGNILELAVFFQTIANELANENGINADVKVFPEFFDYVGTKTNFDKTEEN